MTPLVDGDFVRCFLCGESFYIWMNELRAPKGTPDWKDHCKRHAPLCRAVEDRTDFHDLTGSIVFPFKLVSPARGPREVLAFDVKDHPNMIELMRMGLEKEEFGEGTPY